MTARGFCSAQCPLNRGLRCELTAGHGGPHVRVFPWRSGPQVVRWATDDGPVTIADAP